MIDGKAVQKTTYDKKGPLVVKALQERHFEAYYCSSVLEAKEKVISLLDKTKSIGWGGSMTLEQLGIFETLNNGGYNTIDRDKAETPQQRVALMKQALIADQFILSANAITSDGMIVNVDGNGNRAAAMVYGPDSVIVVAGMNKVVNTLEEAKARTRQLAAPMNSQRFDIKTPCKVTGMCADCKCPDTICSTMVINRICKPSGKIKVILVGEDLGM